MSENIKTSFKFADASLDSMKVTVSVTLTAKEWESFKVHCEKSGTQVGRLIANQADEALAKINAARDILRS